ncbi:MAG: biopolymer transporter ExbD [Pseudomonadota bacterium]|nr:MAG: biopolymer transporter ExbD [Pseudomonadota bacterium]
MNLKPRRSEEPEINLTPLIDVVLLLVVFFMLSSTFIEEGRVRVRLPEASSVPVERPKSEPLVVTVTQEGSYRVNDRELINNSPDTLRAALIREAGDDRSMRVSVRADARATHQSVITAMDVLGRLGFAEISIATVKESPAGQP